MKTCFFILFVALFLNSCTKENFSKNIVGKWEFRKEYTVGSGGSDYPPGNGSFYEFTVSSYKRSYLGQIYLSGSYAIGKDTVSAGKAFKLLVLENHPGNLLMSIEGKKMTLILPGREYSVLILENISY